MEQLGIVKSKRRRRQGIVQLCECEQPLNSPFHACAHAHTTAIFVFYPSQPSQKSLEHDEKQRVTIEFRTYFNTLTKE